MKLLKSFKNSESGAVSSSYVVITAAIAVLATSVVSTVKLGLHDNANGIVSSMSSMGSQSSASGGTSSTSSSATGAGTSAFDAAIADLVHQMTQEQFPDIPPDQIKYLLPSQLAAMTSAWWFGQIPEASKKMLSAEQIQAIPPSVIGPNAGQLTSEQIGWLTTSQFSAVAGGDAIVNMVRKRPSVVSKLSRDQVASVKSSWWFGELVNSAGSSLTKQQLQAALPSALGPNAGKLSSEQIGWLTPDQFNAVAGGDAIVNMVKKQPSVVSKLSPSQIASVRNSWWFGQLVTTAGSSLTKSQLQAALPSALGPNAGKLTSEQIGWLTSDQIHAVEGGDALVNMLTKAPDRISQITPAQIATIQNPWWFGQMPTTVLQAMNESQVKAIPKGIYPGIKEKLTVKQQAWRQ